MVRQIVNIEKLAEAQEAANAAMEAAQITAAKVAEAIAVITSGTKPPDAQVVTSLRLPPAMMIGLKSLAVRKRKTVNDVIVEAIKKHLALGQPL
jgi:hypothetical protein